MYEKYFKRLIDLIIAIIGIPIFVLLVIIFGVLIKLEDRGSIFYKSFRIGKNFEIFPMYKFRSMKENADLIINDDGSTYNSKDDPRVTKIGRFMRETSIDETPQIINVLMGNMSIIGPRASLKNAEFKDDEMSKMNVKPGITGLTQAYFRNGLTPREKRLKDAWYAENISLILDVRILIKTIVTVLKKEKLYTN